MDMGSESAAKGSVAKDTGSSGLAVKGFAAKDMGSEAAVSDSVAEHTGSGSAAQHLVAKCMDSGSVLEGSDLPV